MTKGNIIIAALRLFILRGYKYVSLIDVANETGLTKGGIYHYFSSKEDLLQVASHHLFDLLEEQYHQLSQEAKTLKEFLTTILVERQVECFIDDTLGIQGDLRANFARLFLETIDNFPELQSRLDRSQVLIRSDIEQRLQMAADSGEIRGDLDSHAMAALLFSIIQGLRCSVLSFNALALREQMMDNLWRLVGKNAV
ncbi:MAG: TetR/AcrR family transcriptional regulator [Negativicutes bacterium]|nr:TetR/AcrR family transcriptional regulator [Negativicutes bacterium]